MVGRVYWWRLPPFLSTAGVSAIHRPGGIDGAGVEPSKAVTTSLL
jgi:hypothetical protein